MRATEVDKYQKKNAVLCNSWHPAVWTTWSLHFLSCCCILVFTIFSVSSCSIGKDLSYRGEEQRFSEGWMWQQWMYMRGLANVSTLFIHWYTVVISSWETMSTNLIHGPFSLEICFLTMVSKAMSGVKRPLLRTDRGDRGQEYKWQKRHCRKKYRH